MGNGPWLAFLNRKAIPFVAFEDLSEAIQAIAAYDGLFHHKSIDGSVSYVGGTTVKVTDAGPLFERVWAHWLAPTGYDVVFENNDWPHPRDQYVHVWG